MHLQCFVPALEHLVKFSGANFEHVARSRGITSLELSTCIGQHFGGRTGLNENSLAEFIARHGLKKSVDMHSALVPDIVGTREARDAEARERLLSNPDAPVGQVQEADASETEGNNTGNGHAPDRGATGPRAALPIVVSTGSDEEATGGTEPDTVKEFSLWKSLGFRPATLQKLVPVLEMIVAKGWNEARRALQAGEFECGYPTFADFKNRALLCGPIDPKKVARYLAWAREKNLIWREATPAEPPQARVEAKLPPPVRISAPVPLNETAVQKFPPVDVGALTIHTMASEQNRLVIKLEAERAAIDERIAKARAKLEVLDEIIAALPKPTAS